MNPVKKDIDRTSDILEVLSQIDMDQETLADSKIAFTVSAIKKVHPSYPSSTAHILPTHRRPSQLAVGG